VRRLLHMFTLAALLAGSSLPLTSHAQFVISEDAHQVFTLAPQLYPELFSGGGELGNFEGYVYRQYSSGVYIGLKDERLHLLGGPFGSEVSSPGTLSAVRQQLETEKAAKNAAERAVIRTELMRNWNAHGATTTGTPRLTHLPMRMQDVESILPLGLMVAGHVTPIDHIYFGPIDRQSALGAYEVYVVGNGLISEISTRPNHNNTGFEYRVVLQHTGNFYSYYDLIDVLDPAIASQIPAGALDNGKIFRGPIAVTGGQVLGRIGGKTLDFANVDTNTFLPGFIRPASYSREPWKVFTVDTFAAYDEPLRSQLLAKNNRVAEPRQGRIDYDVSGAMRGTWFLQGTNGYAGASDVANTDRYYIGHLAIAPYVMDPSYYVISLGNYKGQPTQLGVRSMPADPATITPASGIIKLELVQPPNGGPPAISNAQSPTQGTILLQVLPGEQLKVQVFPDIAPASVSGFTDAAQIYVR
jgi:hypothetical protein